MNQRHHARRGPARTTALAVSGLLAAALVAAVTVAVAEPAAARGSRWSGVDAPTFGTLSGAKADRAAERIVRPRKVRAQTEPTARGLGRALSAAAVPGRPTFPAFIDGFPGYEPEDGCSPTAKPGAKEVQRILRVTYGASISSNIVRGCTGRASGHEEGRAVDWMVNQRNAVQKAKGDAFVAWLLTTDEFGNARAMGRRLGIQYVIWKSRILMLTGPDTTWREYADCLTERTARADDTYCHRDHVHVSMSWAGARQKTSWTTMAGLPACRAAAAVRPADSSGASGPRVSVAATTVLDTADGIGTPRLAVPCRLLPDAGLQVRTAGAAGLPATGVVEVALKVTATAAGLATTVTPQDPVLGAVPASSSTGAARPSTGDPTGATQRPALVLNPGGRGTATWWVRVDGQGRAGLALGPAVRRVKVAVVGYRIAGADDGSGLTVPGSDGSPTTTVDVGSRQLPPVG